MNVVDLHDEQVTLKYSAWPVCSLACHSNLFSIVTGFLFARVLRQILGSFFPVQFLLQFVNNGKPVVHGSAQGRLAISAPEKEVTLLRNKTIFLVLLCRFFSCSIIRSWNFAAHVYSGGGYCRGISGEDATDLLGHSRQSHRASRGSSWPSESTLFCDYPDCHLLSTNPRCSKFWNIKSKIGGQFARGHFARGFLFQKEDFCMEKEDFCMRKRIFCMKKRIFVGKEDFC